MRYQAPFFIKNRKFANNIFYAPLAGFSDYPFRKMGVHPRLSVRPGLLFCEMVKIDALVRHEPNTYRLLDYDSSMHPIGAQICGSKISYIKDACRILEDLGFDWIDLNCGCPVDKVTKDGSGSALLRHPEKIGDLLHEMVSSTSLPVSLKIRSGWDDTSINAATITQTAEQAGACLITIHGRTREQAYKGKSCYLPIREAKNVAKNIKVFGNGDVFCPSSAKDLFDATQVDGILVARGTIGRPWIAQKIAHYFTKQDSQKVSFSEKDFLIDHFKEIIRYQTDKKAILDMRRVVSGFLPKGSLLKQAIIREKNPHTILSMVEDFSWDSLLTTSNAVSPTCCS